MVKEIMSHKYESLLDNFPILEGEAFPLDKL